MSKVESGNWISRAINFRLSQRNMIEFAAKDVLNLPVQITGSFFMIRAELIKSIKFSTDLCEDWELTLDVYCCSSNLSLLLSLSLSSSTDLMMTSNCTAHSIRNLPSGKRIFSNHDMISSNSG
jgi:hypothetical protein